MIGQNQTICFFVTINCSVEITFLCVKSGVMRQITDSVGLIFQRSSNSAGARGLFVSIHRCKRLDRGAGAFGEVDWTPPDAEGDRIGIWISRATSCGNCLRVKTALTTCACSSECKRTYDNGLRYQSPSPRARTSIRRCAAPSRNDWRARHARAPPTRKRGPSLQAAGGPPFSAKRGRRRGAADGVRKADMDHSRFAMTVVQSDLGRSSGPHPPSLRATFPSKLEKGCAPAT